MTDHSRQSAVLQDADSDTTIKISELLVTAWHRKWLLVGCVGISLALGYAYLQRQDTVYQIKARLLVQEARPLLPSNSRIRKDEDFLATQAEIVRSPAVVGRAAGTLNPADQPEASPQVASILGSLKVTPVLGTNVLGIALKSGDRYEGVRTVDAIIANYREYLQEMDSTTRIESLRLLTDRETQLRTQLEKLRQEYYLLRQASPLMDQAYEVQKQMLQELGRSMAEARIQKIELEQRIAAVENSSSGRLSAKQSSPGIVSNADTQSLLASVNAATAASPEGDTLSPRPVTTPISNVGFDAMDDLSVIRKQLTDAYVHADELSQRCGPGHPEYKAALAAIKVSKQQLEESIVAAHTVWEQQLSSLQLQELQLASIYNEENAKIKNLDTHMLKEQQALDAIQRLQESYDAVHGELSEWEINNQMAVGKSAVNVTVLEPPSVTAPIRIPPAALMFVSALLGLVLAGGLIIVSEQLAAAKSASTENA